MNCPKCKKELKKEEYEKDLREPNKFISYFCSFCRSSGLIEIGVLI